MVDKEKLLEEIELFGKLDIKYVLEELKSSYKLPYNSNEYLTLDEEVTETIIKVLYFLIEHDDEFVDKFQDALKKVESKNKVADTEIKDILLGEGEIYLLQQKLHKNPKTRKKIEDLSFKIDMIWLELISRNHTYYASYQGDKINAHNYFENINNDGTININNHKEIDFEQKLQEELYKLTMGNMIFNTPREMLFDETKEVTLRISRDSIMLNDLPIENQTIEQEIKISSFMKAILKSNDFDIMALNSEEQIIDNSTATEWKWDITPNVEKAQSIIYLTITVRIPLSENKEVKRDIPVYKRKIRILLK